MGSQQLISDLIPVAPIDQVVGGLDGAVDSRLICFASIHVHFAQDINIFVRNLI